MKAEWTNNDSLTTSQTTKAILVIDKMPNSCDECIVRCDGYTAKEYSEKSIKRPSWCPLKPMPKKKETDSTGTIEEYMLKGYDRGWNDCLKEISGENYVVQEEE